MNNVVFTQDQDEISRWGEQEALQRKVGTALVAVGQPAVVGLAAVDKQPIVVAYALYETPFLYGDSLLFVVAEQLQQRQQQLLLQPVAAAVATVVGEPVAVGSLQKSEQHK